MKKGWPLMSVVPIEDVWIIANFKETQIQNIKVGQKVDVTIDAFSKEKYQEKYYLFHQHLHPHSV